LTGISELKQYFQELEEQDRFSGVVLITRGNLEVYTGVYGYASRAWKIKNTLDTRFDTASITKLFTAVATLQLIDQKRLAFDTRVIDFLNLVGTTISKDITVFHLLTHSSGIRDDADEEAGESYEALWKTKPNYTVTETVDFLPQFIHKRPNFLPGQGCRYCNCGYVLLGLLIEKASGMKYRDYVRQNIFAQAGMSYSDFLWLDRVHEDVAEGSDPLRDEGGRIVGWKKNIYSFPPIGSPDSGAHVTANDLDRFLRAVKAGKLLSPKLTEAFFTPQIHYRATDGGTEKYGYGIWFFVDPEDRVVYCEKDGINAGVSGLIRHFPKEDINLVLLSNMESGVWNPMRKVHEMIVAGQLA
jgi:CubicO group peptidase (beta-lactamase class C family)